jgi:hypothetical protein
MITAGFDSDYKSFMAFLSSGEDRVRFAMAQVTHASAQSLHAALKAGFPKSMNGARAALRLGRVSTGKDSVAYGVYLDSAGMQSKKARKVDPAVNVFYIRPKKGRMVRVPEKIRILQQFSPWTMDSMPFFPSKREGSVITRKVSEKEMTKVRALREQDRTKWAPLLAKEGIHVSKATKVKLPPRAEVVEDVAFRALRLEFGGGDQSAKPIWRPTIRSLAKNVVRSMLAGSAASALSDPQFRGFQAVPKAEIDLSENGLSGYKEFVKRLRV